MIMPVSRRIRLGEKRGKRGRKGRKTRRNEEETRTKRKDHLEILNDANSGIEQLQRDQINMVVFYWYQG